MPTLQDAVREMALEPGIPPPTVPVPGIAAQGEAILPEADLETPVSATQAIEQLARQRYGDAFVDQYGDVMGFRQTGFKDRLRNIAEIMTTKNPRAANELTMAGAQARAELEQSMVEQAAKKRKDLYDAYAFIPRGLKAKMSPRTVLQLFSEQFRLATGQEPHPGVIQALTDMESKGEMPIQDVLDGIADGSLSADDATAMGVDVSTALRFLSEHENRKLRKQEIDQRAGRVGDKAVRTLQKLHRDKVRDRREQLRLRDSIFRTARDYGMPTAQALAKAHREARLPPPTAEDVAAFEGGAGGIGGGIGSGEPIRTGIPQGGTATPTAEVIDLRAKQP